MSRQVVITGATGGIGRAITQRLLTLGHQVIGVGRDFERVPAHAHFRAENIDLSDLDKLSVTLKQLAKDTPAVDTLILCAGRGQFGGLEEFSYAQIRALMDLNFTSQAYFARAFLPLIKRRDYGDIIVIGSEAALNGGRKGAVYSASKFALRGLAQALREECARSGVRVSLVNPGMVDTEFFDDLNFAPGEAPENYVTADDVADAVALILSARPGTVFDEINLSPLKKVVRFGKPKREHGDHGGKAGDHGEE